MENRTHNILRQPKWRIEVIPAGDIYLAHLRAAENRKKKDRRDKIIDRTAAVVGSMTAIYLGLHLVAWVMR